MPIGMQRIGKHCGEEARIKAAYTYEQETKFREKYKPEFKK
jgi:Asp-tRNA(Asn)/Glu-tRNA(Gln) amidotransferase A subunit family amidase